MILGLRTGVEINHDEKSCGKKKEENKKANKTEVRPEDLDNENP